MAPTATRGKQEKQFTTFIEQLLSQDPLAAGAPNRFQRLQQQHALSPQQQKLWQRKIEQHQVRANYYQRKHQYEQACQEWMFALKLDPTDPEIQQSTAEALWQNVLCYNNPEQQNEQRRQATQLNQQVLLVAEGELLLRARQLSGELGRRPRRPRRRTVLLLAAVLAIPALTIVLVWPKATPIKRQSAPAPSQGAHIPLDWIPTDGKSQFFVHQSSRLDTDYGGLYSLQGRLLWQGPPISRFRVHLNLYDGEQTIRQDFDPLGPKQAPLRSGDSLPIERLVRLNNRPLQRASLQPGKAEFLSSDDGVTEALISSGTLRLDFRQVRTLQAGERKVYYYDLQLKNQGSAPVDQLRLRLLWPDASGYQQNYSLLGAQHVPLAPGSAYNYRLVVQPPVELSQDLSALPQAQFIE